MGDCNHSDSACPIIQIIHVLDSYQPPLLMYVTPKFHIPVLIKKTCNLIALANCKET
jgi:hypothetical protein